MHSNARKFPNNFPETLIDELRKQKVEVLAELCHFTELMDLPWPTGYGELPADEVVK